MHAFDLGLMVLRFSLGAVFLAHGINHIFGGGKIQGTGRWFESLGMRPGWFHAWLASITEVASGSLMVLGLFTPLAGAGIMGTMIVAWITNHRGNGFFIFRPGEGWEYVMTLTMAGFAMCALGSGQWSLDHAAGISGAMSGWDGVWIALGAGVGGAAGLLATFWRPQRVPSKPS
jgi:putative oxidoreductase